MHVRVRLFAVVRDAAGVGEVRLELPAEATAAEAASRLCEQFPQIAPYLSKVAYAVNQSYAPAETLLHDGDELALIPPVSGG
jgi:molybdopterin converting factor subunit 1